MLESTSFGAGTSNVSSGIPTKALRFYLAASPWKDLAISR
jgi:hypothetical protein